MSKSTKIPKERYDHILREIQEKEYNSTRYKRAVKFIEEYLTRQYLDKEEEFLNIMNDSKSCDKLTLNESVDYKLNCFLRIKEFINSLTKDQIDSNLYLSALSKLCDCSINDCLNVFDYTINKFNNCNSNYFNSEMDLSKGISDILPNYIVNEIGVFYDKKTDNYDIFYQDVSSDMDKERATKLVKDFNRYIVEYFPITDKKISSVYADNNNIFFNMKDYISYYYSLVMNVICSLSSNEIYNRYILVEKDSSGKRCLHFGFERKQKELLAEDVSFDMVINYINNVDNKKCKKLNYHKIKNPNFK